MSFVPRLATDKQCTGCFACIDVCNKNAINIVEHYDGHRYVEIDNIQISMQLGQKIEHLERLVLQVALFMQWRFL